MARKSNFIGAAANFAIQYNLSVLSLALKFMTSRGDALIAADDHVTRPDFPEPAWVGEVLLGAVFAGTIVGMTSLGVVGDAFGRRTGLLASLAIVIAASLAAAFASWGDAATVYSVLCACRFLVGVGVGGMYPNGAALSAEGAAADEDSAERVGWAFFWQMPGQIAPVLVAYALLLLPADLPALTSVQFRVMLALGALPAVITWVAVYRMAPLQAPEPEAKLAAGGSGGDGDGDRGRDLGATAAASPGLGLEALAAAIFRHPEHQRTLLGTASTWLLWDINCYGTSIFTPAILSAIFPSSESMSDLLWQSLAVTSFGLLGILAAIPALHRFGGTWLSLWGFVLQAALFGTFGALFAASPTGLTGAKFATFCALSFAQGWGCNLSTYVLPTQLFPAEVRATFHGMSAAAGKLGAVIGTFMFVPVLAAGGVASVMWLQVAVCLAGAAATQVLLPAVVPEAARVAAAAAAGAGGARDDEEGGSEEKGLLGDAR